MGMHDNDNEPTLEFVKHNGWIVAFMFGGKLIAMMDIVDGIENNRMTDLHKQVVVMLLNKIDKKQLIETNSINGQNYNN